MYVHIYCMDICRTCACACYVYIYIYANLLNAMLYIHTVLRCRRQFSIVLCRRQFSSGNRYNPPPHPAVAVGPAGWNAWGRGYTQIFDKAPTYETSLRSPIGSIREFTTKADSFLDGIVFHVYLASSRIEYTKTLSIFESRRKLIVPTIACRFSKKAFDKPETL